MADNVLEPVAGAEPNGWKVLIVDDEDDVHHITRLVLSTFSFGGRSLDFLSAYSSTEAKQVLAEHPDVAVILLDVVMDGEDAGLKLVRYIRETLGNSFVRIVLRTGQPGMAPENKVILEYDINDYREKTELTAQKLYTTMVSAVRSYRDIMLIERNRHGLEKIIDASARIFELQSLKKFASGVLEQLSGLVTLERDALYMGMGGFTATKEGEGFVVLAASGRFQDAIGKRLEDFLPARGMDRIRQAMDSKSSSYADSVYVGYIETKTGSQNIVYLENCPGMGALDSELVNIFSMNVGIAFDNIYLNREVEEDYRSLIFTLGDIIERRSQETGHHVQRVSEYARLLALLSGRTEEESDLVAVASAVHDIGKVAIPDVILNKPGPLDDKEYAIMKGHSALGAGMLAFSRRDLFQAAATVASQHHERWDGTGYPVGLAGDDIHPYARIAAIADVFDALTNDRVYRPAWTVDRAVAYFREHAGSQFDPALVDIFMSSLPDFLEIRGRLGGQVALE